jgi:hypothetical protein
VVRGCALRLSSSRLHVSYYSNNLVDYYEAVADNKVDCKETVIYTTGDLRPFLEV